MTNDLLIEIEVLNEYAAGVLADFDRYLIKHGQDYSDGSPVGEKGVDLAELKDAILDAKSIEQLEAIREDFAAACAWLTSLLGEDMM
jgi:hypothetical protein